MRTGGFILICSLLALGCVFSAGCASRDVPAGTTDATPPVSRTGTPVMVTPARSPVTVIVSPLTTVATLPVSVTKTWIPKPPAEDTVDDPQIVVLEFVSGYLAFDISDCGMRAVFPEAAQDPEYGMAQPVPKLVAISSGKMEMFRTAFTGEYHQDPNRIGGAACAGTPSTPSWNVVRIYGYLIPRNARPAVYDIGLNVRSQGKVVEQLRTHETFILDQPVSFEIFVPLKTTELPLFDGVELVFSRRS